MGQSRTRERVRWTRAPLVGVLAAVLVSCNSGDGEPSSAPPTTVATPSTSAPDPAAAARTAVLDGYRKSMEEFVAVASDSSAQPDDPRLAEHSTGDALSVSQAFIFRLRTDGQALTGAVELNPTVIDVGGGVATVADCSIDRTATVELATGRVVSPPGTEGGASTAKLRLDALGVWKVDEFKDERRPCVPSES